MGWRRCRGYGRADGSIVLDMDANAGSFVDRPRVLEGVGTYLRNTLLMCASEEDSPCDSTRVLAL